MRFPLPSIGQIPDRAHPLMRNLLLWHPFFDRGGGQVIDISGLGNHGTLTNMTAASDRVITAKGYGLDFDNTNDHVLIDSGNLTVDANTPLSLCWWEKVTSNTGNNFISRWRLTNNGSVNRAFLVIRGNFTNYTNVTWGGSYTTSTSSGTNFRATGATSEASAVGIWKHFVLVCSAGTNGSTTSAYTLFEDGKALTTSTASGLNVANSSSRYGYDSVDSPSNCQFADVRMYSRVLSKQEINQIVHDPWDPYRNRRPMVGIPVSPSSSGYYYNNFLHAQIGAC